MHNVIPIHGAIRRTIVTVVKRASGVVESDAIVVERGGCVWW